MTKITSVKIRNRIAQFTNETDAKAYARKHGGEILSANAADGIGTFTGRMPVASPFLATSLGLRPDSYQFKDELLAAYNANRNQTSILNRAAVRSAMMEFWAKKRPSLTGSALEQFVKARHPALFDDKLRAISGV
jgi:hypothetical protein